MTNNAIILIVLKRENADKEILQCWSCHQTAVYPTKKTNYSLGPLDTRR